MADLLTDLTPIEKQAIDIQSLATTQIVSEETYLKVANATTDIAKLLKVINEHYDGPIKRAHEAHKSIIAAKKVHTDPLEKAEKIARDNMKTWMNEQERIRRETEKKALEEQRKAQEAAELAMREAEAQARKEQQGQAEMLAEWGLEEEAAAVAQAPVIVPEIAIPVYSPPPQIQKGPVSYRESWVAEIIDPTLIPKEYMIIDMAKINGVAKAMKGLTNIPGVQVRCEKVPIIRS